MSDMGEIFGLALKFALAVVFAAGIALGLAVAGLYSLGLSSWLHP